MESQKRIRMEYRGEARHITGRGKGEEEREGEIGEGDNGEERRGSGKRWEGEAGQEGQVSLCL